MLNKYTLLSKILLVLLYLSFNQGFAQDTTTVKQLPAGKKVLNHTVYDSWKSVTNQTISNDGNWIAYEINPQVGDGKLYIYNAQKQQTDSFSRGKNPVFVYTGDGYLVFKIIPQYKIARKAKLDKKKPDDMPKDTLVIYNLATQKLEKLPNVKSFSANEYSQFIMAHLGKEKKVTPILTKRQKRKLKKHPLVDVKSDGTTLVLWDPVSNQKQRIPNVIEYTLAPKASVGALVVQQKAKRDSAVVYLARLNNQPMLGTNVKTTPFVLDKMHETNGWVKNICLDDEGVSAALLSTTDTNKVNKVFTLFYKNASVAQAKLILDTTNTSLRKGYTVSENGRIYFSPNGKNLFFGLAAVPKQDPKDTLLDEEKCQVDVWHWNDDRIQPEQLKQLDKDKKKTFLTVYRTSESAFVQIENDSLVVSQMLYKGDGDKVLLQCDKASRKAQTWLTQLPIDYYLMDYTAQTKKLLLTQKTHTVDLSYTGKYVLWYEPMKHDWYSLNLSTNETKLITNSIDDNLFEDNNGMAELSPAYGIMGWSKNDEYVYIYSEFEIWKVQPDGKETVVCLTKNKGGEFNTDLRYVKLDKDIDYIDDRHLLLKSFNHHNKREGFWEYVNGTVTPLMVDDFRIFFYAKAKNADKFLYAKMDFQTYPDLLLNDFTFKNEKQLTKANPQQKDYLWGTAELVKWKTFDGYDLEGLLYKPENFDENKKYPMLVYYYEKNADQLHAYRSPRPSASIINFAECASNGYVVFVPDIVYKLGDPGKSAYDCIVSGTKSIIEKGFIDEQNIGLQGQSWGGYQTAFLITQTNMYKAAMAGAPVGNMTSAYGGVRWESGLLRAFQYEKGQSRIGKTLWEDREAYIRNSPVFFLDKVNTPLLLMNNDNDGAVPWYQGIEIYTGLRRLQKPVWLLNYNGDGHNLTKRPNQMDLSIRMMQFFNHYLKGEPMPQWMKEGVPAVEKGKNKGYQFDILND